jgi:1-acyl-sn-glycerol-3-phosphate acyltransferase
MKATLPQARQSRAARGEKMRPYYRVLRALSQAFFVYYFRGRVFGARRVPGRGPVLLACNHQSFFDPVSSTLAIARECSYMARDTLFHHRWLGRLIASLNAFPVRRGAADVGAVKEILRRLGEGRLVVVFPEATRTRDGSIGSINPNSMAIAKRAGATIVPAVVDGAFDAWPRTRTLPRPVTMHVTYAEPITPAQVEAWSIEELAAAVRARMEAALAESSRRRRRACGG